MRTAFYTVILLICHTIIAQSDTLRIQSFIDKASEFKGVNTDSSIHYAKKSLGLSSKIDYQLGIANSNELLGIAMFYEGKFDSARAHLSIAFQVYLDKKIKARIANIIYLNGLTYFREGAYAQASQAFDSLSSYASTYDMPVSTSKAYLMEGIIASNTGNPIKAIDCYQRSLRIEDSLGNKSMQSMLYNNIAIVFYEQKKIEQAIEYWERSYAITEDKKSLHMLSLLENIIQAKLDLNELADIPPLLKSCYEIVELINDSYMLANIYFKQAQFFEKRNQKDSAIDFYNKSLRQGEIHSHSELIGLSLNNLGRLSFLSGEKQKASDFYRDAISLGKEKNFVEILMKGYLGLHEVEESRGAHLSALAYYKDYTEVKDQLLNESNIEEITNLRSKYKFQLEKDSLMTLQAQKELQLVAETEKERGIRIFFVMISAFLLIIGAILYLLYRSKIVSNKKLIAKNILIKEQSDKIAIAAQKEQELHQEKIIAQEKELASLSMQEVEKNRLLAQVLDKVEFIQTKDKDVIKDIKRMIKTNQDTDKGWDTFLTKFEKIYPGFFQKLNKDYSNLTLNDLKLCGYLKIGMSNHEIIHVTNVAYSTIKKTLNRLKKKLSLSAEDDLRSFILNFEG